MDMFEQIHRSTGMSTPQRLLLDSKFTKETNPSMERLEIPQPEQALDETFKPANHPLQLSFGEDGNVAFQTENNGQEQNFRS